MIYLWSINLFIYLFSTCLSINGVRQLRMNEKKSVKSCFISYMSFRLCFSFPYCKWTWPGVLTEDAFSRFSHHRWIQPPWICSSPLCLGFLGESSPHRIKTPKLPYLVVWHPLDQIPNGPLETLLHTCVW